MKQIFAILTASILLASGMHVSIDRHYCSGELAGVKISVTGKLASCAMAESDHNRFHSPAIEKHCCEDQITLFSTSTNYIPEFFSISYPVTGTNVTTAHLNNTGIHVAYNTYCNFWVFPPGNMTKQRLTLPDICVFRI